MSTEQTPGKRPRRTGISWPQIGRAIDAMSTRQLVMPTLQVVSLLFRPNAAPGLLPTQTPDGQRRLRAQDCDIDDYTIGVVKPHVGEPAYLEIVESPDPASTIRISLRSVFGQEPWYHIVGTGVHEHDPYDDFDYQHAILADAHVALLALRRARPSQDLGTGVCEQFFDERLRVASP